MVNLLQPNQLRILSGVLCFMAIGCIVSHSLIFVLLVSNMQQIEIPYSLMGQGVWSGMMTIGTASLMLSFANAKSKKQFDNFCMRGELFAAKAVFYTVVISFAISLFGLLTDGYGCFLLASSEWFTTVGGVTLFGMLLVESLLLLAINLTCFGLIAFSGDSAHLKQKNLDLEQQQSAMYSPVFEHHRQLSPFVNSRHELTSVWPSFTTPSDLYRVKSINYGQKSYHELVDGKSLQPASSQGSIIENGSIIIHQHGSSGKKSSSGYNSDSSYESKIIVSVQSVEDNYRDHQQFPVYSNDL